MEVAGLALGVASALGILGQIFDGCIKAYRVFTTASNLGRDSERLMCKVRIEEMRLLVWGREWGVLEGKMEAHLIAGSGGNEGLRQIAETILTQLYKTIMDFNKLQDKYGLREATPGSVDKEAYRKSMDPGSFVTNKLKEGLTLRAKWVISDKDKFELLLSDLQYFNDRLENLFPPSRIVTLQRTWRNELLQTAQRDPQKLDLLQAASDGVYPGLNAFAQLKHLRINLDAKEASKKILSTSELKLQKWRLTYKDDREAKRITGSFQKPINVMKGSAVSEDVSVLIEFIPYEDVADLDTRLHIYQRVDNLARMLHSSSNRHPDLRTLDCVGYFDDPSCSRYGIVHFGPHTDSSAPAVSEPLRFQTLASLIDNAQYRTPDLDVRFRLAVQLAVSLWSFHSLDWLHKAFCSTNILFFEPSLPSPAKSSPGLQSLVPDLGDPVIAGFDSSRPDHLDEMSVAPSKIFSGNDIYRHPLSLGSSRHRYRKAFDIYSLGLVLLEIGLWKSVKAVHKSKYSPQTFREKVIAGMVPALGSKAGSLYRQVVQRCLDCDDSEGQIEEPKTASPHQVMEWVVLTLESLKV